MTPHRDEGLSKKGARLLASDPASDRLQPLAYLASDTIPAGPSHVGPWSNGVAR